MPQVAIAAGVAAASTAAGTAITAGAVSWGLVAFNAALAAGATLASSALAGNPAASSAGALSPVDSSIGFAPFQQYPASEFPIPILYGRARWNGLVVHRRPYGSNLNKAHFLVVFSEVGSTIEQLYIDKYRVEDLPNYYTNLGDQQTEETSYYNYYPSGGISTLNLTNTGTTGVGKATNSPISLTADFPVIIYGGGTVRLRAGIQWSTAGARFAWRWVLQNIDNPREVIKSTDSDLINITGVSISGGNLISDGSVDFTTLGLIAHDGSENHTTIGVGIRLVGFDNAQNNNKVILPGSISATSITPSEQSYLNFIDEVPSGPVSLEIVYVEHFSSQVDVGLFGGDENTAGTFLVAHNVSSSLLKANTQWSATLEVYEAAGGDAGASITFYDVKVNDNVLVERIRINAAYAHVHLVVDDAISSNNPIINGTLRTNTISGTGGNPADALFSFFTDPIRGMGLPGSMVDFNSVLDAVYWCEENNLTFDRAYTQFYPREQVLREITAAGRLIITINNGIIFIKPDRAELVTYMLSEFEIIPGSLKMGIKSNKKPNRLDVQYVEPFYGYVVERLNVEDIDSIAKHGLQKQTIDLAGVTNQQQAYDIGTLMLKQIQQCPYWVEFECGLETIRRFNIGDVIQIESDRNDLIGSNKWRVHAIQETDYHVYSVIGFQYKDSVYEKNAFSPWYYDIGEFEQINGFPSSGAAVSPVINLQITDVDFPPGGDSSSVTLTFIAPNTSDTDAKFDYVRLEWSHTQEAGTWVSIGTYQNGPVTFIWPMRYGVVTVRAVSVYGTQTNEETAPIVQQYINGELDDTDWPGFGAGQHGFQPHGY